MDRAPYDHDRESYGSRPHRNHDYDDPFRNERVHTSGVPPDPAAHAGSSGYPAYAYPSPAAPGQAAHPSHDRYDYEYSPGEPPASQWSSSRHPLYPRYPTQYSAYPYPPPPGHHTSQLAGAHPDGPPAWGRWGPLGYGGPGLTPGASAGGADPSSGSRHQAQQRPPTPPPPASPSQAYRPPPPPPPPASAPSPVGGASPSSEGGGYLPGFQPDYHRSRTTRRPGPDEPNHTGGAIAVIDNNVRPPPPEAYILVRPHRVPRSGWETGSETASQTSDSAAGWTYELKVLQHPERGKALGVEQLRRGWPPLTPPLIVQMVVKDKDGEVLPTDNAALARRLVHLTMNVELVSPDGDQSRSLMRVRPSSPRGNVQPYYPASAPPPYSIQKTLIGSCVRTAQVLTREGRKGLYFIFQDMIVRPEGRYALKGKVLDLAGPPHIGTSIGVTHPLAHCRTNIFDIIVPQEYPGPVPITPLSTEFLRQGERHLGVSAAQLAANAKQKRRPRNEDGESEQEDAGAAE